MAAPQGSLNRREGVSAGVSYSRFTANENHDAGKKRPTFETPPEIRTQLLEEGTFKDKGMDIDPAKEKSPANA
jgi:hypothetical protein